MKSKIISLLLAFAMFCCISSFDTARVYAETDENSYSEAIKVVLDLKLVTLDDITADSIIQRRDLAEIAVKINNAANNIKAADTVFKDVAKDEVKSGYIQAAYDMGIFNGYFDGSFQPFEAVTYNEAVKVLVSLAGYSRYAERKGGYPYGYISVAKETGILSGTAAKGNSAVRFGSLCKMILNTLETGVMEETGINGENISYKVSDGELLLSKSFDLKVVKGQLTANNLTELTGTSGLDENRVKLGGEVYRVNSADIHSYLGKLLVCYVDKNDTIVTFYEPSNKNEEIVFYSRDIADISSNEIKYKDDDGKYKHISLYDNADFIYNGSAKVSWSYEDVPLNNGEIRMLDSDGDGKYDVMFVNHYVNLIVDRYVSEDEVIYFKYAPEEYEKIALSEKEKVRFSLTDADGNIVSADELEAMDILSVSKSTDGKVYIMKLSKNKVEGTCSAKNNEDITIDETDYKTDPCIDKNSKYGSVELGKKGLFYLNYCGEIAAAEYDTSLFRNYAYLMEIRDDKDSLKDSVYIKVFDKDGAFRSYKLSEKLTINGNKMSDRAIYNDFSFYSAGAAETQLITYEKNSENQITKINSAKNASEFSEELREINFTLSDNLSSVQYRAGNMNMFASRYIITDNTMIFVVPDDMDDEEKFHIIKRNNLYGDRSYEKVKIYDVDLNSRASAVVMGFTDSFFESASPTVGVISKCAFGYDNSGDDAVKLTVNSGLTPVTLTVPEDLEVCIPSSAIIDYTGEASDFVKYRKNGINYTSPEKLKKGDVVQYINTPAGKVSALLLVYRTGTDMPKEIMSTGAPSKNNVYAIKYYTYAEISKVIDNAVRINVPSPDGSEVYERVFPFIKSTAFFKFDASAKNIEEYSAYRLQAGDKVFIYSQSTNVKLVVVYEGGE